MIRRMGQRDQAKPVKSYFISVNLPWRRSRGSLHVFFFLLSGKVVWIHDLRKKKEKKYISRKEKERRKEEEGEKKKKKKKSNAWLSHVRRKLDSPMNSLPETIPFSKQNPWEIIEWEPHSAKENSKTPCTKPLYISSSTVPYFFFFFMAFSASSFGL